MSRVFTKDVIVEGEKKMVKVVDEDHVFDFLLINNQLKVKSFKGGNYSFGGGIYFPQLGNCFKDGFMVYQKIYEGDMIKAEAFDYGLNRIAITHNCDKLSKIESEAEFNEFVAKFKIDKDSEVFDK